MSSLESTTHRLALRAFVRELQLLAGDLSDKDPDELAARLISAVSALPPSPGPLVWWTVRGLTTEAVVRVCDKRDRDGCDLAFLRSVNASVSPIGLAQVLLQHLRIHRRRRASAARAPLDARIERALAYIQANCTRPSLVVNDVASHVRLSRWHLTRLLVRYLGKPYREVVRRARMNEAERLLADDALSMKEVAATLGYPHATELDRVFKQHFGVTPTEWRSRRRSA
jgi:AraC-like DNA-binding protein